MADNAIEPGFQIANAASTVELRALAARLTEADLARDLGEGWTVATLLAHMAFYDFRAAALIDRWQATGMVIGSPLDANIINAASQQLLLAIPPHRAVTLALEAAHAADRRIAAIDDDFLDRIIAAGQPTVALHRAEHRRRHIAQIEAALTRALS